jgi:hypothetical protein
MGHNPTSERRVAALWSLWVTAALVVGASSLVPWFELAFHNEDVEALESPLVLSAARQLVHSPWQLYGPYDNGNRLVMIHAPLYYRATAILAWPLYRAGVDPVLAALFAGRALSLAGLLVTLVGTFRLARQGGAPRIAGWWAALLAAATPVYGGLPFEVRPDLAGVGLQTIGVLLFLKERGVERPRPRMLFAAFFCFGAAACIKQHFVMVPAVSTWLLLAECRRGRLGLQTMAGVLLAALGIVVLYYGFEEWVTRGLMSRSVFIAAARVGRVHPAGWFAALNILTALVWKCVGLILLLAAAGLFSVSTRAGRPSKTLVGAGAALVGAIALLAILQFFLLRMWLSVSIALGLIVILAWIIPTCSLTGTRSDETRDVETALWAYLAAELALAAVLCKMSTGAWYNYAIQGVVFACVLVARSLARGFAIARSRGPLLAAALAASAVPAFALTDLNQVFGRRLSEQIQTGVLLRSLKRPSRELFFVDRPGDNRLRGRTDLVYDPWLYPVFESSGQAEPRQTWLARELAGGAIRIVLATSPRPDIDGITPTLPELGYRRPVQFGAYFVWVRVE